MHVQGDGFEQGNFRSAVGRFAPVLRLVVGDVCQYRYLGRHRLVRLFRHRVYLLGVGQSQSVLIASTEYIHLNGTEKIKLFALLRVALR